MPYSHRIFPATNPCLYHANYACTLSPFLLILPLLAVLASACSDTPATAPEEPGPEPPPEEPVASVCDDLSIASGGVEPLGVLRVTGFTGEFGEVPAGLVVNEGNELPVVFYMDQGGASGEMIVPPHPSDWRQGGSAELIIASEDLSLQCDGFSLTIAPLEEQPGESRRLASTFQDQLEAQITKYGFDPEALLSMDIRSVDPVVMPLVASLKILDPEEYENSPTAILDGTAPILGGEPLSDETIALLDAVTHKSGIVESQTRLFDSLADDLSGLTNEPEGNLLQDVSSFEDVSSLEEVFLVDPSLLADAMTEHRILEARGEGASGFATEFGELAFSYVSLTTGILAAALTPTGAGAVAAGTVSAGTQKASVYLAAYNLAMDAMKGLLPSEFSQFELLASPIEFNEDSEEVGEWVALLDVRSEGYIFSASDVLQFVPADKLLNSRYAQEAFTEVGAETVEFIAQLIFDSWAPSDDSGIFRIPSATWRVYVDTERENEEQYFEWELVFLESWDGSDPFRFYTDPSQDIKEDMGYEPLVEGASELRLRVNPEPFAFPVGPVETQEVRVHPIEISFNRGDVTINLNDASPEDFDLDILAEVFHADDETLEWEVESGEGFFTIEDELGHHVIYHVPRETGVYLPIAEAVTETGPRASGIPPRRESIRVTVTDQEQAGFLVFPNPGCVTLDEEVPFTALMDGTEIPFSQISWTVEGSGTLGGDGLFLPDSEGRVRISFAYEDANSGETLTSEASFLVLESCGELLLESSRHRFSTGCVIAQEQDIPDLPFDLSNILAAGWIDPSDEVPPEAIGGAELAVSIRTSLRDSGEWSRTFDNSTSPGQRLWNVATFRSASGNEWENYVTLPEEGEEVLTLERTERVVGGESIGLYSGEFQLEMFDITEAEQGLLPRDQWTVVTLRGSFSGVPYSDGERLCLAPPPEESDSLSLEGDDSPQQAGER